LLDFIHGNVDEFLVEYGSLPLPTRVVCWPPDLLGASTLSSAAATETATLLD